MPKICSTTLQILGMEKLHGMDFASLMFVTCLMVYVHSEFVALGVGVLVYLLLERANKTAKSALKEKQAKLKDRCKGKFSLQVPFTVRPRKQTKQQARHAPWKKIYAPVLDGECLETQMLEFSRRIAPSADGDDLVASMTGTIQKLLHNILPGAEVMGFTVCDILQGTDFGLSNPEVDIVLTASPAMLAAAWTGRIWNRCEVRGRPRIPAEKITGMALQKAVLRECTSDLAATNKFKFRRSAFESLEPSVTLVAPPATSGRAVNIPIRFAVNATTPLYNYALVRECGRMDARARDLILFVRRWAKFRGISQENKGHPSPYLWTLLVVHFLHKNKVDGTQLIPSLSCFKLFGGDGKAQQSSAGSPNSDASQESIAVMYQKFVSFYANRFEWTCGVMSLCGGMKAGHMEENADDIGVVRIEDPFDPRQTLNRHMTAASVGRVREEFQRAEELLGCQGSVTDLLEPWISPEHAELASGSIAGIFESEASRQTLDESSTKSS